MSAQVAELAKELEAGFQLHPDALVVRSLMRPRASARRGEALVVQAGRRYIRRVCRRLVRRRPCFPHP